MLRANAHADSIAIQRFQESIQHYKAALEQAEISFKLEKELKGDVQKKLEISQEVNHKLRKSIRKERFFKWIAIGGAFVLGVVAIQN